MRFGPVPVAEAAGLISAHTVRRADITLRKGAVIAPRDRRGPGAGGAVGDRRGGSGAGRRRRGCRRRAAGRPTGRTEPARRGALHRPLQPVRGGSRGAHPGSRPDRRRQRRRRGRDGGDAAALQARGRRRDGRHREDHPVRGPGRRAGPRLRGRRRAMRWRSPPYRRHRVGVVSTRLPSLKEATIDKTLGCWPTASRRPAPRSSASPGAARRRGRRRGPRGGDRPRRGGSRGRVRRLGHRRSARRHPGRHRGRRGARVAHLGMPVDPGNLLLVGSRGARAGDRRARAARARPRRTASTGSFTASWRTWP